MLDWVTGPTPEAVPAEFARRLRQLAASLPAPCPVALTGGGSAAIFYEALALAGVPPSLHFYWSDERLVPPDDPDSNFRLAAVHLLRPARVPPQNLHPVPTDLAPDACAAAYAEQIRRLVPAGPAGTPRFPLIILGLGEDGHTGSLFPGRNPYQDDELLVRAVAATPDHPHPRVTFTPRLINAAAEVWFVITGDTKQWAVEQLAQRSADVRQVPSLVVSPEQTRITIFRA